MPIDHDLQGSVAYSYARFSDPSQGAGHSLERQKEYAPEFCEEFGCKLNTTLSFADLGKSAFHGAHISAGGGLKRFLECIDAGLVAPGDVLIVENLDRVSRLPLDEAEDLLKSILTTGVRIHTRSPWSIYDRDTLRDPMQRMQMIMEFTRSYRESKYKQERLTRRWIRNREQARNGEYKLAQTPAWLQPVKAGTKVNAYRVIPERAAIVRNIFQMCADGHGLGMIAKMLNKENTPTFGKSKFWQRSIVSKIIHNRAVLGEYQPFSSVKLDGRNNISSSKRVATGDVIVSHYPAIIATDLFDKAQLAIAKRSVNKSGRGTSQAVNLFSGLIVDARDGSTVFVVDKGYGPRLTSNAGANGASESTFTPYELLENAFAVYVDEMPLELVAPRNTKAIDKSANSLRQEIESLELQVAKIKHKTRTNTSDALLELLVERDTELKTKQQELEVLERQRGSSATIAAKTTKDLLQLIRTAKQSEVIKLRTKLRSEIRYWCKAIHLLPMRLGSVKALMATVELTNGQAIELRATAELIDWPAELDDCVAKDFNRWPKSIRKTSWDALSTFDSQLKSLHDKGLELADIAEQMGSTVSKVSKRLLKLGCRRRQRQSFTDDRLMAWSEVSRGWVRTLNGKRHYVGAGTLKKLYPKLVTSNDEAGTRKAANRWWKENF
jgi:DNA invertase Pin-like site-specific DNA recombinase